MASSCSGVARALARKAQFMPCVTTYAIRNGTCNRTMRCVRHLSSTDKARDSSASQQGISTASDKAQKISQAMKVYLERAKAHDQFMQAELQEFEMGRRHLANIMGTDPDMLTQEEIDKAIEYLLPSGLFDKKARPKFKHPTEVIPNRKAAQFGIDGRPFHYLFYTGNPNYFQLMHEVALKTDELKAHEDRQVAGSRSPSTEKQLLLAGSEWIKKNVLESKLQEKITDVQYVGFTKIMERLAEQSYSILEKEFIMKHRKELRTQKILEDLPPLQQDENGRQYQVAEGARKRAKATVKLWEAGSGQVIINGKDMLSYFPDIAEREQIMFPLQLADMLGKMDVEATVEGGGPSGQAGAIRLATGVALQSFVPRDISHKMRIAGLLTRDPRVRERKKPGQAKARKKFTWKKR